MARWRRRIGITLGSILGLLVVVLGAAWPISGAKIRRPIAVTATAPVVPTDSASVARGRNLADIDGCTGCHTPTLQGSVMMDRFPIGRLIASNLTRGRGGVGASYTDADWDRAIRHGLRPNGEHLIVMPSEAFHNLSDRDVADIIAFVKSAPPVDNEQPHSSLGPVMRVAHVFGAPLAAAEQIDHAAPVRTPEPGATVEYGAYLALSCRFCHGERLEGGSGGEPGSPPAPNLTPAGDLKAWTEADFFRTMQTGVTPAGRKLDNHYMPWQAIGRLSETEQRALWMYVHSRPAVAGE